MTASRLASLLAVLGVSTLATAAEPLDLRVSRVAIFSSGVGYFECEATVEGDATAELRFRTEQINDVLKSMVVQDADGGHVGLIGYPSQDPLARTLASFGVDLTQKPTFGQLLDQLRGETIEISGPKALSGRIVGVEQQQRTSPDGQVVETVDLLTVSTDTGLERIALRDIGNVRLTNDKVAGELRKALETLAQAHDADKKTVTLRFEGQGQRHVRVAYLLEAPIWKTTYRLVLSEKEQPFLQGWATVDNATEEDWENVRLSLVSGRPISFRMDLYTPLYVPRPMEQLEIYAALRPPEYAGGFPTEAPPPAPAPEMAGRAMLRRAAKADAAPQAWKAGSAGDEAGTVLYSIEQGVESAAQGVEAGELFAYNIERPVSIQRQRAALLPIVNQSIEATKVSIFNPRQHPKFPFDGLELKNTSGLNLMQGPITVFDGGTYAGDAKLPDLQPDEKRLVAYALDLETEVLVKQQPQPDQLVSLRIAKGTLWHRHKLTDTRGYELKNKSDRARTVLLEQPYDPSWTLVEPAKPYERTEQLLRFKVDVPAQKTVSYTVKQEYVSDQSVALSDLALDQIQIFLNAREISPKVVEALQQVVKLRDELDRLARQVQEFQKSYDQATREQARVRDNLDKLDKQSDVYKRQLEQFEKFDKQINDARQSLADARAKVEQQRQALEQYLLSLNVE